MRRARFALLAHAGSRRALGFAAACRTQGFPEPRLIGWEEALSASFDPTASFAGIDVLRIETPADCPAAERILISRGATVCRDETRFDTLLEKDCAALPDDDGQLRYQLQWYDGWLSVLEDIGSWCAACGVRPMNAPAGIATLFDKQATRWVLQVGGVPVPAGSRSRAGFDDVVDMMERMGWNRVFLKPCHGSSASGVMAIARSPRGAWKAVTSAVLEAAPDGPRIRNLKRPRVITCPEELRKTVDAVCRQHALLERWFPKATLGGRTFDLRVLVIAGKAAHVVVRTSRGPITNLHLDNRRGDLDAVRNLCGEEMWQRAMATSEAAAACFPGCHYVGVDLMIGASLRACAVAEVNAFGDLLHRDLWQGMNPWEAELFLWRDEEQSRPSM